MRARLRGGHVGLVIGQPGGQGVHNYAQAQQVVQLVAAAPAARKVVQPQQLLHGAKQALGAPAHLRAEFAHALPSATPCGWSSKLAFQVLSRQPLGRILPCKALVKGLQTHDGYNASSALLASPSFLLKTGL